MTSIDLGSRKFPTGHIGGTRWDLIGGPHVRFTSRSPTLKARVEALQAELAKVEASAAGHRSDFERERERADGLMAEL